MKISYAILIAAALHTPLLATDHILRFSPLSTVRNGDPVALFGQSAAEIVKFDPVTKRMFVINGATDSVDIFDATNLNSPTFMTSVDLSNIGNPNSIDINPNSKLNEVAVAVGAPSDTSRGSVVFINKNGVVLGTPIQVGYLPDMLTYDAKGKHVVVANEGQPNAEYTQDPEGSVSIISIHGSKRTHQEITFSHLAVDDVPGVRISGPQGTTVAQDLEPEYVAISGNIAFVTCQENNAVAKIDIVKKRLLQIMPLGAVNHGLLGNAFDGSDRDFNGTSGGGGIIRIANWPIYGLRMPDGIATYTAPIKNGSKKRNTFFVTANEGDAREYGSYLDETRLSSIANLDPSAFPLGNNMKEAINLGRLKIVNTEGKINENGAYEQLFSFGSRSFSIFDQNGTLVFDSGEMIEAYLAANYPNFFNSSHDSNTIDARSDDKGPEPEAVEIGIIGGKTYAFIGLERFSGIFVCDITNPREVKFAGFAINRDFNSGIGSGNAAAGDLGPEGLDFVSASKSPNGKPLLVVANEISGTTTIYEINQAQDAP